MDVAEPGVLQSAGLEPVDRFHTEKRTKARQEGSTSEMRKAERQRDGPQHETVRGGVEEDPGRAVALDREGDGGAAMGSRARGGDR